MRPMCFRLIPLSSLIDAASYGSGATEGIVAAP